MLRRCFNCGGCGHMSRECVQAARPRPCNVCGASDHRCDETRREFPAAPSRVATQCALLPQHALLSLPPARPPCERLQRQTLPQGHVLALPSHGQVPLHCPCSRLILLQRRAYPSLQPFAMGVPPCTGAQSSSIDQCNRVPQLRQVRCAAHAHEHDSRSSCTVAGHSAYHCRDAPFNEQLLRPGADVSRCVVHHSPLFCLLVRLTSRFTCIWCLFLQPYASGQRCSDRPMEEQRRQEKQERFAPEALAHLHIIHSNTAKQQARAAPARNQASRALLCSRILKR